MIVLPSSFKLQKISITISVFFESRFPVGSSAIITRGSFARALAMATLCCSPPEI